ncbi:MAG: hypothetical protein ACJ77M_19220 [Thermoleophilaceae bacterium]
MTTLGAAPRRLLRHKRRRPQTAATGDVKPVPTVRATLVDAEPLPSEEHGAMWLDRMRRKPEEMYEEAEAAARELNGVLRAQRTAALDPYVREVSPEQATTVRVGYGAGEEVAYGRFADALELPQERRRASRRDMIWPQGRLAAILSGQEELSPAAELTMRARLDIDAGRPREAALQTRVALEALLAELPGDHRMRGELEAARASVGQAANAALEGDPPQELRASVEEAVRLMHGALRR